MAIIKKADNIKITVTKDYNLTVGGKLEKVANKMNVEATAGNLLFISNKKIVTDGNKR
ncbi:hypothetical protein R1T16_03010 [Flavobacterium sp. DG1-102-2]|uniref:hypothetical protein n=1 Tax=Flavobacterium sp. DG1-102-2 TaxID=3081663 RepID=UPI0029496154|nr:hypothetical protein [Flavobacterium sp. DG1-102-2]MDV6167378.1 hypothetical protein [Flavobacterium sp. DG1-102-2]